MASSLNMRVRIEGLKDCLDALAQFQKQGTRSRILRPALNLATKPMLDAARATVRVRTGLLRKSLTRKVKTYRKNGVVVVIIGPRTGRQTTQKGGKRLTAFGKKLKAAGIWPHKYAHFVEKGTYRTRAYPFLRPAFHRLKSRAAAIIQREVWAGIRRELARVKP